MVGRRWVVGLGLLLAHAIGCQEVGQLGQLGTDAQVEAPPIRPAGPGWAVSAGGPGSDGARELVIDPDGNLIVAGWYSVTAKIGAQTLSSRRGAAELFVAKLDPSGNVLWAVGLEAEPPSSSIRSGLAVDELGNIYVAGSFTRWATFGSALFLASGDSDLFVARLDPSCGKVVWAIPAGSSGADSANALAVQKGQLHVLGTFSHQIRLGSTQLVSNGATDLFVARLPTAGGAFTSAVQAGGPGAELASRIILDGAGNATITGAFAGKASFGSHQLPGLQPEATQAGELFVARLDANSTFAWARTPGAGRGDDLALDGTGVWVVGRIRVPELGPLAPFAPFLVRYTSEKGDRSYWSSGNGTKDSWLCAITASGPRDITVAGAFAGTTLFAPTSLSAAREDVLVARLEYEGVVWADRVGGNGRDSALAMARGRDGSFFVAGTFEEWLPLGGAELRAAGAEDAFVWKTAAFEPY